MFPTHGCLAMVGLRFWAWLAAAMVIGYTLPMPVRACNVPVFRYALERWRADAYRLSVFHTGPLDPALKKELDAIAKRPLNVEVSLVNLDAVDPKDPRLTGVQIDRGKLPWMVLRYPDRGGPPQIAWSGRLDDRALALVTDSPLRQEIVRRLLSGESGVWVFLESGDADKDRGARELLEREIAKAEKELHIPEPEDLDYSPSDLMPPPGKGDSPRASAGKIPLKVDFSLLTLSRKDAEEAVLVRMLVGSEPDLDKYAGEPMAFLLFGQGRVLWAIVGKGINADNVQEACAFLTAACSCQVKSMNPGTDLLTCVDWYAALEGQISAHEITAKELTTVAPRLDKGVVSAETASVQKVARDEKRAPTPTGATAVVPRDTPREEPRAATDRNPGVLTGVAVVLGLMLLLAATATIVLMVRKQE